MLGSLGNLKDAPVWPQTPGHFPMLTHRAIR